MEMFSKSLLIFKEKVRKPSTKSRNTRSGFPFAKFALFAVEKKKAIV